MTSAITAAGLRKSFGGTAVLDGIDLEVGAGTTFSLLGPHGAGKTTIVQIMSTLVHADGGEVRVAGHDVARDPAAVRDAIGVTGQFCAAGNLLTGAENLLRSTPGRSGPPPPCSGPIAISVLSCAAAGNGPTSASPAGCASRTACLPHTASPGLRGRLTYPSDEADESDVKTAQQVRVDYAGGMLRVTGPKPGAFDISRKTRSVELSIELPSGSRVSLETQAGDVHCAGRLGECRLKTSAGNFWLEQTGLLRLKTGFGHVTADSIAGSAEISTGSGKIQIGEIEGTAVVRSSNADFHAGGSGQLSGELVADGTAAPPGDRGGGWQVC